MDRKATEDTLWIRKRISHVRKKVCRLRRSFLLGATVLLLIEMYFIVNLPRVYLVQIILGAAILACTYAFIAALLKEIHKTRRAGKRRI